jgi:hypothetical protein
VALHATLKEQGRMANTAVLVVSLIVGGAWHRWEGASVTGFPGHRWRKLTVAAVFGFA